MSLSTNEVSPSSQVRTVVDGDSHMQEPAGWLVQTDSALARSCSGQALLLGTAGFACVDPRDPPDTAFWRTLTRWARDHSMADVTALVDDPHTCRYFSSPAFDPDARIAWLDGARISHQICNPTIAAHVAIGASALSERTGRRVTHAYNEWARAAIGRNGDRLHPTILVDLALTGEALGELEAGAEFGSASFLLPIDEGLWRRLAHPDAHRFWKGVASLGLMPSLHLGVTSRARPGLPTAAAWADMQLQAQRCLLHWVSSRHAANHPTVRVLVQELGVDWALPWMRNLQRAASTPVVRQLGATTTADRSMLEVASTQIVWLPLPRDPLEAVLREAPTLPIAFGSDFPHSEGWGLDPVSAFEERLAGLDVGRAWMELGAFPTEC